VGRYRLADHFQARFGVQGVEQVPSLRYNGCTSR
jgi:hypothetical protein